MTRGRRRWAVLVVGFVDGRCPKGFCMVKSLQKKDRLSFFNEFLLLHQMFEFLIFQRSADFLG